MSLTIRSALEKIPIMSELTVIAGESGVDNVVTWTHIVDIPGIIPTVKPGTLLLTNAYSFPKDAELQREYIKNMSSKNAAGLVVAVGKFVSEIPSAMIAEADQLGFPLLSVPWRIRFVDITYPLNREIIREENLQIDKEFFNLTQIVINNGTINDLAEKISEIIHNSVLILDTDYKQLVWYSSEKKDFITENFFSKQELESVRKTGSFSNQRENNAVHFVEKKTCPDQKYDLLIRPIYSVNNDWGFIIFIKDNSEFTQMDNETLTNGASAAALMMSRSAAIIAAKKKEKKEIFQNLVSGYINDKDTAADLIKTIRNYWIKEEYEIVVIRATLNCLISPSQIYEFIDHFLREHKIPGTVVEYEQYNVLILNNLKQYKPEKALKKMMSEARYQKIEIIMGQSSVSNNISDFKKLWEEANELSRLGVLVSQKGPECWNAEKAGILEREVVSGKKNYYEKLIEEIINFDDLKHTDYFNTLSFFIQNGLDVKKTSDDLFIHRNTLRQRLQRIKHSWSIDLSDPFILSNVYLAIIIHNYRKMNEDELS